MARGTKVLDKVTGEEYPSRYALGKALAPELLGVDGREDRFAGYSLLRKFPERFELGDGQGQGYRPRKAVAPRNPKYTRTQLTQRNTASLTRLYNKEIFALGPAQYMSRPGMITALLELDWANS